MKCEHQLQRIGSNGDPYGVNCGQPARFTIAEDAPSGLAWWINVCAEHLAEELIENATGRTRRYYVTVEEA